jgi:DsbC/DsbD-like thiol-disulfide interchange protein
MRERNVNVKRKGLLEHRTSTCVATIVLAMLSVTAAAQPARPKADATPIIETTGVHAGTTVRLALRVALPDGLHVQADKPRDPSLIPTALMIDPPTGITVVEIVYPKPTDLTQAGQKEPLAVFEQTFTVGVRVNLDRGLLPGDVVVPARLRYQACNASFCYAPDRENVQWTVMVVPAGTPTPAQFREVFDQIRFSARPSPPGK